MIDKPDNLITEHLAPSGCRADAGRNQPATKYLVYNPLLCLEANSSYLWDTELRPGNAGTWDGSVELLASCFHQRTISSESRASSMLRQSLVASQVAVSLVLLVGAIAFAGTLANPRNLDPGFRNDRVLTMSVELPEGDVKAGKSAALWRSIADSVRAIPEVKSASLATFTPLSQRDRSRPVAVRGYAPAAGQDNLVHWDHVSEGYFETLGIPLLEGRLFTVQDTEGAPRVAVINEAAARKFFSGRDPLGQVLAFDKVEFRIVGVVRDA